MIKNIHRNITYQYMKKRTHTQGRNPDISHQYMKHKPRELLVIIPAIALIQLPAWFSELALGMWLEWIAGVWDRGQVVVKDVPFWKQPIFMLDINYWVTTSLFIQCTKLAYKILLELTWSLLWAAQICWLCSLKYTWPHGITRGRNRTKVWLSEPFIRKNCSILQWY